MTRPFYFLPFFALLLGACSPRIKTIEVERQVLEYRDRLSLQRDSVYQRDSIHLEHRGDTIYLERWHTKLREVVRYDTAYLERRDSIAYPVVVEVEKPRHWLQRLESSFYRLVALLLLIYIGWHSIRKFLWRRRL